jgi:hypothetical protein
MTITNLQSYSKFLTDNYFKDCLNSKLIYASASNDINQIEQLLRLGADPLESDYMAITKSIEHGYFDVTSILLGHVINNDDLTFEFIQDILSSSTEYNQLDIIKLILDVIPDSSKEEIDWSYPLSFGCKGGHYNMVDYLLTETDALRLIQVPELPLQIATEYGRTSIVELLLSTSNKFKPTHELLVLSLKKGFSSVARLFVKHGIQPEPLPPDLMKKLNQRNPISRLTDQDCCVNLDTISQGSTYRMCLSNVPHYFTYDPKYNQSECPMCRGKLDFDLYVNL